MFTVLSCDAYLYRPLLLISVMLYFFLYLVIYFCRVVMWCLSLSSSLTHFFDVVFLSVFSYVMLPFCHVMFMVLLFFSTSL